jgi:uncharacterized protein YraI
MVLLIIVKFRSGSVGSGHSMYSGSITSYFRFLVIGKSEKIFAKV